MPELKIESTSQEDRLKEITKTLEQGVKDLYTSEKYREYLDTMSKFHNYSVNNTMLIVMQNPEATYIAGYNSWKNNFERNVKKGEKGIKILAPAPIKVTKEMEKLDPDTGLPMFDMNGKPIIEEVEVTIPNYKVVSVFDVNQTDGKELPALTSELGGSVKNYDEIFNALKEFSPVPIGFEEMPVERKGYYNYEEKRIAIREGMSEQQSVKTVIHEIAHARLHDKELSENSAENNRFQREVEAESVAYVVCKHYGIDTSDYSFGYIAQWSMNKESKELKNSLETIHTAASEIISGVDEKIRIREKEQEQPTEIPAEEHQKINREIHDTQEKNDKKAFAGIIGTVSYAAVKDKQYFKMNTALAENVSDALTKANIPFSGRVNGDKTTLTIGAEDVEKYKVIVKRVNTLESSVADELPKFDKSETKEISRIIGNTAYREIQDKKFINIDSDISGKAAAALEAQGIKFSGKENDNNKTTFTVSAADLDKFNAVIKTVKEQEKTSANRENHDMTPAKPYGIIGNTPYKDIKDKKYLNISNELTAREVRYELEKQGVNFSGKLNDGKGITFTVSAVDVEKVNGIIGNINEKDKKIGAQARTNRENHDTQKKSITDSIKEKQTESKEKPAPDKAALKSKERTDKIVI